MATAIATALSVIGVSAPAAPYRAPQEDLRGYLMPLDEVSTEIVAGPDASAAQAQVHGWGWRGNGVVIAISDFGVDSGDNLAIMHLDLRGRVRAVVDYAGNGGIDSDGHGTHVAGIAVGAGAIIDEWPAGKRFGLGVAPGAEIVAQNTLLDPTADRNSKAWHQKIFRDAVQNGATISSNSWCWPAVTVCRTGYDQTSAWLDEFVRDADHIGAGDQPLLIVFAAGNDGGGVGETVNTLAQAKNVLAIAASENERSDQGFTRADSRDDIAGFSSEGPASDKRLKPDITAPGTWIASALSQSAPLGWCDVNQPRALPKPLGDWGRNINSNYEYCSGTSMSAPHVSGGAALFAQYYRSRTGALPSPALMKAALINSGRDMGGSTTPIPNFREGWGRLDLVAMLDSSTPRFYLDQSMAFTEIGQTKTLDLEVISTGAPLKVTLVWTDRPGDPTRDPSLGYLVNDLDLKVISSATGNSWIGNTFFSSRTSSLSTGWTPANAGPNNAWEKWDTNGDTYDDRNNVESVYIQNPSVGRYLVQVAARTLPQPSQDFALVVSGAQQSSPVRIEAGADRVAYEVVRIFVDAPYATSMRFSNDNAIWSDWEPYAASKYPWLLSPGKGTKTVFVQVKDASGNTIDLSPAQTYVQYWNDRRDVSRYARGTSAGVSASGFNPRVIRDAATGRLCAVWWEEVALVMGPWRVMQSCSADTGVTWSPRKVVWSPGNARHPDLATDGTYMHLVWQQEGTPGNWDAYYSRWNLLTETQDLPPVPLPSGPGSQTLPRVAHGDSPGPGANHVHAVFQEDTGEVLYVRNDLNGAGAWSAPTVLSPTLTQAATIPSIEVEGSYVHVVFEAGPPTARVVYYVRNTNYGSGSWVLERSVWPSTGYQSRADIALSTGYVHVVWEETAVGALQSRIYYRGNTDNGEAGSWRITAQILSLPVGGPPTGSSARAVVRASGSNVAVAWQGDALGHLEVNFARHVGYGSEVTPWERWSRLTFAGYYKRDAMAPSLALGAIPSPPLHLLWQDEVWGGWDISYKTDVTMRGEPPFYGAIASLSVDIVTSSAAAGNPVAWTYQETVTMSVGTWASIDPGGMVWNRHRLTEQIGPSGSAELEAIYRLSVPHAEGHEDGPGTMYAVSLCAQTTSTTDIFQVYYGFQSTGPWGLMTDLTINVGFACGTQLLAVNAMGHHGYVWIRIKDSNLQPVETVIDTVTIESSDFEGIDGPIWLTATLPAGYVKADLRLRWAPSIDDPAVTPGGPLVRYDIYMSNGHHDSFFVRVGSVPTGSANPEFILPGGAVAGSPEVRIEGPVAVRIPRDAYFGVVGRDAAGRAVPFGAERVGRFTVDLPAVSVLLSIPLITPSTVTPQVFAQVEEHWDMVRWYDGSTGQWKTYRVGGPNTLPNVDRTMGLWLHLTADANGALHTGLLTVVGDIPDSTQIPLRWVGSNTYNLVGYPYLSVQHHEPFGPKTVAEALQGICYLTVETYDPNAPPYYLKTLAATDLMLPGLGYWVYVNCAATWTLVNSFPAETLI